ncbi:SLC13 family permease [Pannus brasiliensis CCIBt3594]|uniref:SLC13 family permease n=1 Tax=Pannus brasiliensis CCIBt3594 TaxID=1427578 RepID=A0AAW9QVB2_9CHRO
MLIVFGILAVAVGLFAWGRPRADIVALLVVLALMVSGILTPGEALAGFGSPVVILIAAVFIVSEGLVNTGVAQRLGEAVVKVGGKNETRLVVLIMLLAGSVGAVLSSSALAAMLIPVVLTIANKTGLNRKRMLMPLCIAVTISGMMTLIASSSNIIIENILRERGATPLGFFSWAPIGIVVLAISILFTLSIGRDLLSRQRSEEDAGDGSLKVTDTIASYDLENRWHRLSVPAGSSLVGHSVAEMQPLLRDRFGLVLVGFEKHRPIKTEFSPALPETIFEADDIIFTLVGGERLPELRDDYGCREVGSLDERQRQEALQDMGVAEVMLSPESKAIGKPLSELEIRSRYRLSVLALRHRGRPLIDNLRGQVLDFGDTLLVGGRWEDIDRLRDERDNFVILNLPAEYRERLPARGRAPIAVAILLVMVAIMVFQSLPNAAAALIAALAMVAGGCVRLDNLYRAISWKTLVLIAGMLPLATALSKTGATTLMANGLVKALGSLDAIWMLGAVFLITALVGLFISNSVTAVLIAPIAIEAADALHVSPQAFAMTVAIACSASYVTPVSAPANMLVMEPGGYTFGDYVKVGLPLLLLTAIATVVLVRILFPL